MGRGLRHLGPGPASTAMGGEHALCLCRELRGAGRARLLYAEQSRAGALSQHVVHLAATGKSSTALRGTILAVRMAEKLQLLWPTVGPIHWAIAAGVGRTTPNPANRSGELWVCSEPWPWLYAPRPTLPSSPSPSSVSATAFGSGRPQHTQGRHHPAEVGHLL